MSTTPPPSASAIQLVTRGNRDGMPYIHCSGTQYFHLPIIVHLRTRTHGRTRLHQALSLLTGARYFHRLLLYTVHHTTHTHCWASLHQALALLVKPPSNPAFYSGHPIETLLTKIKFMKSGMSIGTGNTALVVAGYGASYILRLHSNYSYLVSWL